MDTFLPANRSHLPHKSICQNLPDYWVVMNTDSSYIEEEGVVWSIITVATRTGYYFLQDRAAPHTSLKTTWLQKKLMDHFDS
jgi:hypothetical protein